MALAASIAFADSPLWMRDIVISPDGKEIAFTYKGDIFTVAVTGGKATRLTSEPSREWRPVWSPDGKQIAFASDRFGGADVFVMDANGGVATRLTHNTQSQTPETFTPDGKFVVFSAAIQDPASSVGFPARNQTELYKIPVEGGQYVQMFATPATNVAYVAGGKSLVFEDVKGSEDRWRKHHTSSIARDIWSHDLKSGKFTKLTSNAGEDRNPVVAADGKTLYFLSERDGKPFNIYKSTLGAADAATQLTDFGPHPVRFLSRSDDGKLAFGYNGEIFTMTEGDAPRKVNVDITTDNTPAETTISINGVKDDGQISPSGKQFAFTNRGEVFVTSVKYPSIKQITHTPAGENHLSWGKDDRELYYDSQRDGYYNIYKAAIAREGDPNFSNATVIDEARVFPDDGVDRNYPNVSPDGKKIAYVQDRTNLMVMDLASGTTKQLTDTTGLAHRSGGFSVEWSPDSRWILLTQLTPIHDPYSDIAVVNAETGEKHLITNTGYFDENPHWAFDGEAVIFFSERYGMRAHASWGTQYDVMITFLTQDAYDKFMLSEEDYDLRKEVEKEQKAAKEKSDKDSAKKDDKKKKGGDDKKADDSKTDKPAKKLDFANLDERTVRLTPNSSDMSDALVTANGNTLFYLSRFNDDYELWKKDLRKGDVSRVTALNNGASSLQEDADGNLFIIGRAVKKMDNGAGTPKNISTSTKMRMDPNAERAYMFNFVRNEERERFYDKGMHGVDWTAMTDNYERFLPHINNNADFADMLSELLGELNVSHTGGRYFGPGADQPTASLGLLYDMAYEGPELKVDEIVDRGPFDRATTSLKPGMLITAINGVKLDKNVDTDQLLADLVKKKTLVSFRDPKSGRTFDEVVIPISSGSMNDLLYNRWVKQREADVDRWSNGRLGYVHIQSMDDASFRKIYAKLLGEFKGKEGVVIDTRWNGGGRMHEDIEVLFTGKKYLQQYVHGVKTSEMPSRRWNKPSIMVMGEANYSNAHGTPWVYKTVGIGKLVGMPVPGTMTSVNWQRMQDPSLVFGIPVTGYRTAQGNYLENTQLEPDIKIANTPEKMVKGEDEQLHRAVDELLNDLKTAPKSF